MDLSIIIPVYNEEESINKMYDILKKELKHIKNEIIFVNDGSTDNSSNIIDIIYNKNKNIKIINFSRNFGKDAAIYAGMEHASGKYTAIIDADMQQNPKYLIEMFDFLENNINYDQVCMIPKKRKNIPLVKRIGGVLFYKLINKISTFKLKPNASDFRMFRNNIKEVILSLKENNRFSKELFNWIGFETKYMEYDVEPRLYGKTKFNLKKSFEYALNGIINYSTKPLILFIKIGLFSFLISIIWLIILVIKSILIHTIYSKIAFALCIILLIFSFNISCIAILNLYLKKILEEVKKRPVYIIKDLKR